MARVQQSFDSVTRLTLGIKKMAREFMQQGGLKDGGAMQEMTCKALKLSKDQGFNTTSVQHST